jgi:hypothetical protein
VQQAAADVSADAATQLAAAKHELATLVGVKDQLKCARFALLLLLLFVTCGAL